MLTFNCNLVIQYMGSFGLLGVYNIHKFRFVWDMKASHFRKTLL